jgi:hypothetical protein
MLFKSPHPYLVLSLARHRHLASCVRLQSWINLSKGRGLSNSCRDFQSERASHPDWIRWLQFSSTYQCVYWLTEFKESYKKINPIWRGISFIFYEAWANNFLAFKMIETPLMMWAKFLYLSMLYMEMFSFQTEQPHTQYQDYMSR